MVAAEIRDLRGDGQIGVSRAARWSPGLSVPNFSVLKRNDRKIGDGKQEGRIPNDYLSIAGDCRRRCCDEEA